MLFGCSSGVASEGTPHLVSRRQKSKMHGHAYTIETASRMRSGLKWSALSLALKGVLSVQMNHIIAPLGIAVKIYKSEFARGRYVAYEEL